MISIGKVWEGGRGCVCSRYGREEGGEGREGEGKGRRREGKEEGSEGKKGKGREGKGGRHEARKEGKLSLFLNLIKHHHWIQKWEKYQKNLN